MNSHRIELLQSLHVRDQDGATFVRYTPSFTPSVIARGTLYAGIYITDDEDGSFSLVRSTFDTDSDCHATETIATVDASLVSALVVIARTNAEIAAKGLLPLGDRHMTIAEVLP